jgi:hypothetical protein
LLSSAEEIPGVGREGKRQREERDEIGKRVRGGRRQG